MRKHVYNARHGGALLVRSGVGRCLHQHIKSQVGGTVRVICPIQKYVSIVKKQSGGTLKSNYKPLTFK